MTLTEKIKSLGFETEGRRFYKIFHNNRSISCNILSKGTLWYSIDLSMEYRYTEDDMFTVSYYEIERLLPNNVKEELIYYLDELIGKAK